MATVVETTVGKSKDAIFRDRSRTAKEHAGVFESMVYELLSTMNGSGVADADNDGY
jgi:hypothetical protein